MNRGGGEGSGEGGGEESLSSFFSSVLSHLHKEYRIYFDVQHTQKVRGSSITNPILNMSSGTCMLYCLLNSCIHKKHTQFTFPPGSRVVMCYLVSPPPVLQHAALVEQQHSLEHHAAFSDDALGLFNVQYVHLDVQEASTLTFIAAVGV